MSNRLRDYLELMRLPAVFTAIADVLMGTYVGGWSSGPAVGVAWRWEVVALLVAASSALYLAGMVLNDYFDRAQDAVERPKRPIPSGRIAPGAAVRLGRGLLLLGIASAFGASFLQGQWLAGLLGLLLAAWVVAYDAALKQTPLGPLAMGACRGLNVLLGMSVAVGPWQAPHYLIAGGLGLYITGVTWISRSETGLLRRSGIFAGVVLMWCGMAAVAWFPRAAALDGQLGDALQFWFLFWAVLGLQIGWRALRALVDPTPGQVQAAVKQGILSLIVFDATIVFAVAGSGPALMIIALLVPTFVLGRWFYVT